MIVTDIEVGELYHTSNRRRGESGNVNKVAYHFTIVQEAINKLEQAGVKPEFAAKVVEHSGLQPSEIINIPAQVLEVYWYENVDVDFLDQAVAVNVEELKRGLRALQFQDSIVNEACKRAPRDELLGHRDIFIWGLKLVENRL